MKIKLLVIFSLIFLAKTSIYASDTLYLKVHFLYGSKPKKAYKDVEKKWFGGMFGGHVGIEYDSNKVIDFIPKGKFHKIAKKHNLHSRYAVRDLESFWGIFGSNFIYEKTATVIIPVTLIQKQKLDSIVMTYSNKTPYDYAFMGMRCGSATYDILAKICLLKKHSYRYTIFRFFYPKKLRKKMFRLADNNNWQVIEHKGIATRKWEHD